MNRIESFCTQNPQKPNQRWAQKKLNESDGKNMNIVFILLYLVVVFPFLRKCVDSFFFHSLSKIERYASNLVGLFGWVLWAYLAVLSQFIAIAHSTVCFSTSRCKTNIPLKCLNHFLCSVFDNFPDCVSIIRWSVPNSTGRAVLKNQKVCLYEFLCSLCWVHRHIFSIVNYNLTEVSKYEINKYTWNVPWF